MQRRLIIELLGLEKGKAYGFQEYIFNLLNFFYNYRDEIRYERIIIWCKDSSIEMFKQFEDKFELEAYTYSSFLKKHWLQTMLPIKKNLTYEDLLFSPGNVSGFVKRGTELLTIHDLLFKRKGLIPSKLMRWQREILIPRSIRKADSVVAISYFTKDDIELFYPQAKGKVEVIYNSFNFSKFEGSESSSLNFNYFLAISTNMDYKNQRTILKAYEKYCEGGGRKKIVFVGKLQEGTEAFITYNNLPQEIKMNVFWKCGLSNEELGALYRGASCFISASKFEGLGMPVVEAMSFGLPVLLSDIPPHKEVSMNKGEYFDVTDTDGLAFKMLNMSFEKLNYDVEIKKMFSDENTSALYIKLINRLYSQTRMGGAVCKLRIERVRVGFGSALVERGVAA